MYGLTLIAILVIMGGAIAFIGDKLGTRVGKRRLTMFGLRPKHTSIIVTIVTGILIAGSTLGMLTLASDNVRTALFGMEALQAQLQSLTGEVSTKNQELEAGRVALEAKTTEYSALTIKVAETSRRLTAITKELVDVTSERDTAAAALGQVQADYSVAKGDLDKSQQEIASLQATKNELDAKVVELNEARTALQSDVDSLNELTANLKKGMQVVRQGIVVFQAGEVLGTSVIKAGRPVADIAQELTATLYQVNQSILSRLHVTDKNLEVLWIGKADFEEATTMLTGASGDVIVRVSSRGNIVYGEPVIGHMEFFPNRLVYAQGTTVFSDVGVGGGSAKQSEEVVVQFLQKVNAAAISKGILPDPIQGTVGMMGGAQLYDAVNKVKRSSGGVQLTAAAKTDIYTVGPLQIEIQVQNLP